LDLIENVTGHVYIIDCDNAYGRLLEGAGISPREEWFNGERVEGFTDENGRCSLRVVANNDWPEFVRALQWAFEQAGLDDWVVVDGITRPWHAVKDWAVAEVHGKDMPAFLLQARLDAKGAKDTQAKVQSTVLDLYDPVINPSWHSEVTERIVGARCHVYIVADENSISPRAGKDTTTMYEKFAAKPDTQKRVGHNVATIIHGKKTRLGAHEIELVKDWGREARWPDSGVLDVSEGFVKGYLKGVAKWKPVKG
jgi:hypothetical protein